MVIVGIDFGTTNSTVAYSRNGKVTVVEIDQSARYIPSCVAFNNKEMLVGAPAVRQMAKNSPNTVFDIKRLLGCSMGDAKRHKEENMLLYKLDKVHGKPKIQASYKGITTTFHPEEIVALILSRLKEITLDYVGEEISNAVITVPTSFNALQRRVLMEAARIADVPLLGLINETTAAAISHGLKNLTDTKRITLVFHLGGGSFDVALIKIKRDVYDVKATCGNARLGGQNFTNSLVNKCVRIFNDKKGIDLTIPSKFRALSRLRYACDKAKADLGLSNSASIKVEALSDGNDFEYTVTEEEFEILNRDMVDEMRENINRVLAKAGISKDKVDDVVAVGAATRMKLVKKLFSEYEFESVRTINTNEAVATGAAVYGAYLGGEWSYGEFDIRDVLSHDLTIHYKDGVEGVLFKRGRSIPGYTCLPKANSALNFKICCTIKSCPKGASSLTYGKYSIAERVKPEFIITADGVLKVCEQMVDERKEIKETSPKGGEGVRTLRKKANEYQHDDAEKKRLEKKLHKLEKYAYTVKANLDAAQNISSTLKQINVAKCDHIIRSLEEEENPSENQLKSTEAEIDKIRMQISESENGIRETTQDRTETSFSAGGKAGSQDQPRGPVSKELQRKMDELQKEVELVSTDAQTQRNKTAMTNCMKITESLHEGNMTDAKLKDLWKDFNLIKNELFEQRQVSPGSNSMANTNSKTSKGSTPKSNKPEKHESSQAHSNPSSQKWQEKAKEQKTETAINSGKNSTEDKRNEGCCVIS